MPRSRTRPSQAYVRLPQSRESLRPRDKEVVPELKSREWDVNEDTKRHLVKIRNRNDYIHTRVSCDQNHKYITLHISTSSPVQGLDLLQWYGGPLNRRCTLAVVDLVQLLEPILLFIPRQTCRPPSLATAPCTVEIAM